MSIVVKHGSTPVTIETEAELELALRTIQRIRQPRPQGQSRGALPSFDIERAKSLAAQGKMRTEIAAEVGAPYKTVQSWLLAHGIAVRSVRGKRPGDGRNVEQEQAIVAVRRANPCMTLRTIGQQFGLSRERVRQLLQRAGEKTSHYTEKRICMECGSEFIVRRRVQSFCNAQCRYNYTHPLVSCDNCGILFRREQTNLIAHANNPRYKTGSRFCGRRCRGSWMGKTYGFGVNPEGRKKGIAVRRLASQAQAARTDARVTAAWEETGRTETGLALAKRTAIPRSTIYKALKRIKAREAEPDPVHGTGKAPETGA